VVRSQWSVGDHCAFKNLCSPRSLRVESSASMRKVVSAMGRIYNRLSLVKLVQSMRERRNGPERQRLTKQDLTLAEPTILALDTSSKATSLAIARAGTLLRSINDPPDEKRSDTLWTEVRSLLAELGMTLGDVDIFAVCVGPGGFTGLRVGMAAAKGFAAATNKPIIGVTSLEAAAFAASPEPAVCAMVNAYKGEVYSQMFSFDGSGVPVARNDPMASTVEKALERIDDISDMVFAGDGAYAGAEAIDGIAAARGEGNWTVKHSDRGVAEDVARLAFLRFGRGEIETAVSLKACYVRRAEAEIKLSLGLLGSKIKRSMKPESR
jgi:tRNA threonylcarbamoyladenosine biosynthesis protein TsaB